MKIVFFGSTSDSVLVLEKLPGVVAVVTQPPRPVGRKQIVTATPVEEWATSHSIPVTTRDVIAPFKPDLLVSASYGEKIPMTSVNEAPYKGLNVHPSLLPRWRGGDPVPWAILSGDRQTGVTIVTIAGSFDAGEIVAQKKIPITEKDTTVALRPQLFAIGANLLIEVLKHVPAKGSPQQKSNEPYARRLTRDDGFEPWENIIDPKQSERLNRKFRAFNPWPGLWTKFRAKRLKILSFTHEPVTVQLEGKTPVSWEQFKTAYLSP